MALFTIEVTLIDQTPTHYDSAVISNTLQLTMKLEAFTEDVADLKVRYSVLHMNGSAMVWADGVSSSVPGKRGSLPSLALSVPSRIASLDSPSTATVLMGAGALESQRLSDMLTRRTGMPVYAHVRLPPGAESLADTVSLRLLRALTVQSSNGASGSS